MCENLLGLSGEQLAASVQVTSRVARAAYPDLPVEHAQRRLAQDIKQSGRAVVDGGRMRILTHVTGS